MTQRATLRGMSGERPRYGMTLGFGHGFGSSGEWQIYTGSEARRRRVVWRRAYAEREDTGEHFWPADMRAEYERLTGKPEFGEPEPAPINIVELIGDESAFDQPCAFGNRVESHAVYCHNDAWLYAPRKCRRTWYTGGETRDEDCPGFKPREAHR